MTRRVTIEEELDRQQVIGEIVDVLQEEMRGIVEDGETRVTANGMEESLEAGTIVDVLAGIGSAQEHAEATLELTGDVVAAGAIQ